MLDTGRLDRITTFPALIDYLRDELDWPIDEHDFDELTFEYSPEEVGLDSAKVGGGIEIKQLRPLTREQPWGIFFVNLPKKQLSTTILRALLGSLAPKKRASSNPAERAAFAREDLMFIASTGDADHRHIDFAHFRAPAEGQKTAPLQVLGWDADDTERRMHLTAATLKERLRWPEKDESIEEWRERWTEAFREPPHYSITESKALAEEMARLAKRIRGRVTELIEVETDKGPLRRLYEGFKEALIHDLTPEKFADYYAQTITYGLFSARVSRPSMGFGHDSVHLNVAGTSPFLKEMLSQFMEAGGRQAGNGGDYVDFDALGVGDVVAMLEAADMDSILADWDHRNQDEDPVVHFYQDFLNLYDPGEKKKRGVFYTPRPIVSFIVRSVDEVLRTEFGLEDGLASIETWAEVIARKPGIQLPKGAKESDPFVRILDPATGTGTFLVECVELIHKTMVANWVKAGHGSGPTDRKIIALWNDYVPKHLLPRLYGFELMMAPYAIAHVKLGLTLSDTGYVFGSEERARIYLTNALEPAQDFDMQLAFMSEALAHEAQAANKAKEVRFTGVIGNPPYAGHSSNPVRDGAGSPTYAAKLIEPYFSFQGSPLNEKQPKWLLDDYVKFTGLAQHTLAETRIGVLGYITNHGYIDNPTFRGMRESILEQFSPVACIDLGGSVKKGHLLKANDDNVFDIEQGTAILLAVSDGDAATSVNFGRLIGSRKDKYDALISATLGDLSPETITPAQPFLAFDRTEGDLDPEWREHLSVKDLFPSGALGIVSGRDAIAYDIDRTALVERASRFADKRVANLELKREFELKDAGGFVLAKRRPAILGADPEHLVKPAFFRPFDNRFVIFSRGVLTADQSSIMQHLQSGSNLALVTTRTVETGAFHHAVVSGCMVANHSLSMKEANYTFPLWIEPVERGGRRTANLSQELCTRFAKAASLQFDSVEKSTRRHDLEKTFGPRDVFDWIYAVLHSPAYRSRYADYLKSDYPRIPLPAGKALFQELVPLGTKLVALHLLDTDAAPELKEPQSVRFAGYGEARVEHAPQWSAEGGNRVAISARRWFEGVPERVWNFHIGGYQPAAKWLKDRAAKGGKKKSLGRVLTAEDQLHYRQMIVAMDKTIDRMAEIDGVIEKHGGWPGAFEGKGEGEPESGENS
jgi:hypothetical protein